ncbi:MAG: AraC family transcriptional regulator [Chloroflexi bacterium]|nr:AraC family transcriptional regulator [Chloroflexota bacterium]
MGLRPILGAVSITVCNAGRDGIHQLGANMTTSDPPRIALLAAPETSASVLYGLYDVLLSVGPSWPDMTAAATGDALLEVSIVAADAEPFRCFGNILVEPHAAVGEVDQVDAVVVCDMYTPIDTPPRGRFAVEIDWLRRMHAGGALLTTVCTGSLLLAEAGLLDGRSCAGHWAYRDLFQSAYPRIRFGAGAVLDLSSEGDRLITAGGVTSWQDLALHLIAKFCGPEHAARTAKVYLLGGHEDGQLPFSAMTRRVRNDDAVILDCLAWIADNYRTPNPVTAMTDQSGLTTRTFARRFQGATGQRPIDYVHALRMEGARLRLETGPDGVDDVGYSVGYEDPTFFRRLFKRTTGMTPAAYRRKYAPILATV